MILYHASLLFLLDTGRTKLEPVSIIILSVVMALASLQLVRESVEKIVTLTDGASSLPDVDVPTFAIAGGTVGKSLIISSHPSLNREGRLGNHR